MSYSSLTQYPPAGTVVWIRAYLIYRHRGIVSDQWWAGKPKVISNSLHYGVVEQPWDDFAQGQDVQVEGYPGRLPSGEVLNRARSRLGADYNLTAFNCDHLVNEAHGLLVESEQLKGSLAVATFLGLLLAATAK
jgi:hypothetical protein